MKDQLMVIADTLGRTNEDWICSFQLQKEIGKHIYNIAITRLGSKLELTAWLPVYVEEENHSEWAREIRIANESLDCGAFSLCDNGKAVCYRVYSLYTHADEVKGEDTIMTLLNSCYAALKTHGEAMQANTKKTSLVKRFLMSLGVIADDADDVDDGNGERNGRFEK